jgi:hypothetical protein
MKNTIDKSIKFLYLVAIKAKLQLLRKLKDLKKDKIFDESLCKDNKTKRKYKL